MFSSSELIEALRRRARRSLRPLPPAGEFPPAWQAWFQAMTASVGKVTGALPAAFTDVFIARTPVFPGLSPQLSRWQAFASLWRQGWRPHDDDRDDRGARLFAMASSLLFHVLWLVAMIWLMYARFTGTPELERRGEQVIQVEFIGEGTQDAGGAAPAAPAVPSPADAASQAAAGQPPAAAAPTAASTLPQDPTAEPTPAPPVPPPTLVVTEVPEPDSDFTLQVPELSLPSPRPTTPAPPAPDTELTVVDVPLMRQPSQPLPQRAIDVPVLRPREVAPAEREVPAPLPEVALRPVAPPGVAAPTLRTETRETAARDIALRPARQLAATPSAASAASPSASPSPARPSASAATSPATTGTQPSGGASRNPVASAGTGTRAVPTPGGLPASRKSDDWGDSNRQRPGGQLGGSAGLFNADGSPRLASGTGRAGGGLPPGTITEDYEKIDRMGTWLKRPPVDYQPSAFDRFWVPSETLLQEWVRRSIKEVLIPLPGTSKSIKCTVALLMLGGGCGISDPNMQDIEATARKPPDIPFKRELQEDQSSLAQPEPEPDSEP